MAWPELIKLSNQYYVAVHFPATLAFLVWGYLRRPLAEYRWARALLVSMTGIALVLHVLIPLAPPRMFPHLGFVDTMTTIGPSAYSDGTAAIRVLALAHAALTSLVVVVTANQWWVDGLVATALLGVALLLHRRTGYHGSPAPNLGTASARGGGEP